MGIGREDGEPQWGGRLGASPGEEGMLVPGGAGGGGPALLAHSAELGGDPPDQPGVAHGGKTLPVISGRWLRGTQGNAGLFPKQIADRLRGRLFASFDQFRSAFWEAVGEDPALSEEFGPSGMGNMRNGNSPKAVREQQYAGYAQGRYILHHKTPIHQGGDVYDMDNLCVVTPRFEREILDPAYHYR